MVLLLSSLPLKETFTPNTKPLSYVLNRLISTEDSHRLPRFCSCGRRHFLEAATTALLSSSPSMASELQPNYKATLNRIHPPRPDWYEEFYAWVLSSAMEAYEAEIAIYKSKIFANLRGEVKQVMEMGIGTGPNLKYYANRSDMQVFGVDPNRKMEKYALEAAVNAGLPPTNFKFIHAVGEAIPLGDASVDAVVGTLVLCSVKDVDQALQGKLLLVLEQLPAPKASSLASVKRVLKPGGLYVFVEHVAAKDGTSLRLVQNVLDPLQQIVADGCHLTRETGKEICEAGFLAVDLTKTSLQSTSIINPHVYGIAVK